MCRSKPNSHCSCQIQRHLQWKVIQQPKLFSAPKQLNILNPLVWLLPILFLHLTLANSNIFRTRMAKQATFCYSSVLLLQSHQTYNTHFIVVIYLKHFKFCHSSVCCCHIANLSWLPLQPRYCIAWWLNTLSAL